MAIYECEISYSYEEDEEGDAQVENNYWKSPCHATCKNRYLGTIFAMNLIQDNFLQLFSDNPKNTTIAMNSTPLLGIFLNNQMISDYISGLMEFIRDNSLNHENIVVKLEDSTIKLDNDSWCNLYEFTIRVLSEIVFELYVSPEPLFSDINQTWNQDTYLKSSLNQIIYEISRDNYYLIFPLSSCRTKPNELFKMAQRALYTHIDGIDFAGIRGTPLEYLAKSLWALREFSRMANLSQRERFEIIVGKIIDYNSQMVVSGILGCLIGADNIPDPIRPNEKIWREELSAHYLAN